MKISVSQNDCNYIVDKENRRIICLYRPPRNIVYTYLSVTCPYVHMLLTGKLYDQMALKSYYRGIAVCAEGDEWDEDFGKLVAFNKVREKYYNAVWRRVNHFFNWLDDSVNESARQFDYMGDKWNKSIDMTEKLIKAHFEPEEP